MSLNEIIFLPDSHLKEISGFVGCTSLFRIELPSSVKDVRGFKECNFLRVVVVRTGCRVQDNKVFRTIRPFLIHENAGIKAGRRLFHLGTFSLS
jgi:hypothetical protein